MKMGEGAKIKGKKERKKELRAVFKSSLALSRPVP